MKTFIIQHKLLSILSTILLISITIPLILEFGFKINQGDWSGFWGSYLGIIPSGIVSAGIVLFEKRLDHIDSNKKAWDSLYDKMDEFELDHTQYLLTIATLRNEKTTAIAVPDYRKDQLKIAKNSLEELFKFRHKVLTPFTQKYSQKWGEIAPTYNLLGFQLLAAISSTEDLLSSNPEETTLESCGENYYAVLESFAEIHAFIQNNSSFS